MCPAWVVLVTGGNRRCRGDCQDAIETVAKEAGLAVAVVTVKAEGKGHRRGSPHAWGAMGFFAGMATMKLTEAQQVVLRELNGLAPDAKTMGEKITLFRSSQGTLEELSRSS